MSAVFMSAGKNETRKFASKRTLLAVAAVAGIAGLPSLAPAAAKYWDTNPSTSPTLSGGNGTWGTDSFWSTASTGTALTSWADNDDAFFQDTGSTTSVISLNNTILANSLSLPAANIVTLNNGTLQLGSGGITKASSGASLTINSAVTLGASQTWALTGGTVTVAGNIGEAAAGYALTKTNSGTLVLTGTNSYTGGTTINGGAISFNSASALGNGTLTLGGGTLTNTTLTTLANTLTSTASTTTTFNNVTAAGTNLTLNGNLTGSGTINTQNTTNTDNLLTLGGNKSGFTGNFTINKVTLVFSSKDAGSASAVWTIAGGGVSGAQIGLKLDLGSTGTIHFGSLTEPTTFYSITTAAPGSGSYVYTMEIGEKNLDATLGGNINDAGATARLAIIKAGTGKLTLSSVNNSYAGGTTISGGILSVSMLSPSGQNSNIGQGALVLDGGTLQYTGAAISTNRLFSLTSNGGTLDSSGTGALTFSQAGSVTISGSGTRTLTLTGSNNGTLTAAVANDAGSNATSLTKNGAGTWTLAGANTYTGETRVTVGTLALNNAVGASLSSSSVLNVASGATFTDGYATGRNLTFAGLKGAGTLNTGNAANKFISAGTLAAGDSGIGTLTIATGSLQVSSGAILAYEIGGTTASPTSDLINLTGTGSTVTFEGAWTVNLSNLGTVDPTGKTFVLFDSLTQIAGIGTPAIGTVPTGWTGGTISINSLDNTQVVLSGVTVPEPTMLGLVSLVGSSLLLRRRKTAR